MWESNGAPFRSRVANACQPVGLSVVGRRERGGHPCPGGFGFEFDAFLATHCRVLATVTEDLAAEITLWRIEGDPATMRHKAAARTMRRSAASLISVRPPAPAAEAPALEVITAALAKIAENSQPKASDARKVIMANVIDPADSGEVPVAAASQVREWDNN